MQLTRKLIMIISFSILGALVVFTAIYTPLHYRMRTTEYVEHEPIVIWRDIDFIGYQFPGKGTAKDPYRIENLNIKANETEAIYISSTTQHFVIQNCLITNIAEWGGDYGIYIEYAGNGTVEIDSNVFDNFRTAIFIESSRIASISNNNIDGRTSPVGSMGSEIHLSYSDGSVLYHNNLVGNIDLDWCNNSIIENNDILGRTELHDSDNSILVENIFRNDLEIRYSEHTIVTDNLIRNPIYDDDKRNVYRIRFYRSGNSVFERNNGKRLFIDVDYSPDFVFSSNEVRFSELTLWYSSSEITNNILASIISSESQGTRIWNNILDFGGLEITEDEVADYYNYNIDNNTVNGKPLGYFTGLDGGEFTTSDYGQLIFVNSRNIQISNQEISDTRGAIALYFCNYMDIIGNDLSENSKFGINLFSTHSTLISGNDCNNNGEYGIKIDNSHNLDVIDNTVIVTLPEIEWDYGIIVYNSDFVDIQGNTIIGNYQGIRLRYSDSCTISENTCDLSEEAINVYDSYDTLISNNEIVSNYRGLSVSYSENSIVSDNVIINCAEHAIEFRYSVNSTCANNTITYGGIDIEEDTLEDFQSYSFSDNEINGKQFGYYFNLNYVSFTSSDYAQLFLFNCSNIFITNQTFSNVIKGLILYECDLVDINGINCINNEFGIGYYGCNSSSIISNTFINSKISNLVVGYSVWMWHGTTGGPFHNMTIQNNHFSNSQIDLREISYSTIENNTLYSSDISISYDSRYLTIFNNTCYDNTEFYLNDVSSSLVFDNIFSSIPLYQSGSSAAIYSYSSDNITIFSNYIYGPKDYGIRVRYSENCSIFDNEILHSGSHGIDLYQSASSTITNNTCSYTNENGMRIDSSTNITISNNICNDNKQNGIHVTSSDNLNITDNICNNNQENGIVLRDSEYSEVSNNFCDNNPLNGIYIEDSNDLLVSDNIIDNSENGIILIRSYDCETFKNTIQYCLWGLVALESSWIVISNNTCDNNTYDGISIGWCDNLLITNNTVRFSNWGIAIGDSRYCEISNNLLTENSWAIDLYYTHHITVLHCNISFNEVGIHCFESEWNSFLNNTISFNVGHGIDLENSNSTHIAYNLFSNNTNWGVMIISGNSNTIYYNAFIFNQMGYPYQGMDDGTSNNWNYNYWNNWTSGTYEIAGSAGSEDLYPLASNPL